MEMRGCAAARKVLYETGRTAVYCIRTSTCVQYVYRTAVYSNTVHTTYICMLTLYRMIWALHMSVDMYTDELLFGWSGAPKRVASIGRLAFDRNWVEYWSVVGWRRVTPCRFRRFAPLLSARLLLLLWSRSWGWSLCAPSMASVSFRFVTGGRSLSLRAKRCGSSRRAELLRRSEAIRDETKRSERIRDAIRAMQPLSYWFF